VGSAPGVPATPADQLALNIDPVTYVIVEYRRSGGLSGVDEQAQLFLDGHVVQERAGQEPVTFQLSPAEQAQLTAAFDAADFYGNARQAPTPGPVPPDAFQYQIMRRGLLLQGILNTHDGEMPAWAQPLLPLLDNLLLSPERAVAAEARAESAQAATATPGSLAILLLEFARLGPDGEDRLLLNLDRTYSLARAGQVSTGELSAEDMVALLKLLEGAQLAKLSYHLLFDLFGRDGLFVSAELADGAHPKPEEIVGQHRHSIVQPKPVAGLGRPGKEIDGIPLECRMLLGALCPDVDQDVDGHATVVFALNLLRHDRIEARSQLRQVVALNTEDSDSIHPA